MDTTPLSTSSISSRDQSLSIFSQVMGLVAITCLFAAAGAYIGKDINGLWVLLPWIISIGCIFGLYMANSRGAYSLALVFLFALGLLLGLSIGQTLQYYAVNDSSALYQAAAATGLLVGVMGSAGMAIRKDLSFLYRFLFFGLILFFVAGIILIFINIPVAGLIWSIIGLVLFSGYVLVDFNRLRRAGQGEVIPLAASIFLDIFNIFLLFLRIFGSR